MSSDLPIVTATDHIGLCYHALQLPEPLTRKSSRLEQLWYALDYHAATQWCGGRLTESVDTRDIYYRYIEIPEGPDYSFASDGSWILQDDAGNFFVVPSYTFDTDYTLHEKENETV
jgi:hypothetical protein